MKLLSLTVAVLAAGAWFATPRAHASDTASTTCMTRSAAALDALARDDYATAGAHFSPDLAKALAAPKLKQAWTQVQTAAGAYRSHAAAGRYVLQGRPMVVTPISFANTSLDLLTRCDDEDRLIAFQYAPSAMVNLLKNSRPAQPVRPHVQANGVRVQPATVPSPAGPLQAVLTLPPGDGPFPAVVLVSGSGANDFDETIGPNKPFRDIAEGLAEAGVASLRYDKRNHDYPEHWSDKGGKDIDSEVTDDALIATHMLARVEQVDPDRVFVLGHSLGAMMAPRIGKRDPRLAGLILMAAPTRSLLDVLVQQAREQGKRQGLSEAAVQQNLEAIRDEQKLLANAGAGKPPTGTFMGGAQSYWLSMHHVHQVTAAKGLTMPMLLLQGGADFQVSPTLDFAHWKQALSGKSDVAFHLYPGLSHLFMPAGKTGTVADYAQPGHVDPEVIHDIAAWINAQSA